MNAGLSNLATLKAWLLPASLLTGTDYDATITAIGLGVAAHIEKHCNRTLARAVEATYDFPADRRQVIVDRFPIEEITKVEVRTGLAWGFVDQGDVDAVIENLAEAAGMVHFAAPLGVHRDRARLIFTGGFWWNQQEADYDPPETPTEEDPDLSALPEGAAALPADLRHAWLLQCEQVWKVKDRLGLTIGQDGAGAGGALLGLSLPGLDLNPLVLKALQPFIRYALI